MIHDTHRMKINLQSQNEVHLWQDLLVHARPDAKLKGAVVIKEVKAAQNYASVLPNCV
jgi:hypothetical protein